MSGTEKPVLVKKISRKQAQKAVFEKLSGALEEYKTKLDKKKFDSNLKKASKIFAADLIKAFKKDRKNKSKIKVASEKAAKVK